MHSPYAGTLHADAPPMPPLMPAPPHAPPMLVHPLCIVLVLRPSNHLVYIWLTLLVTAFCLPVGERLMPHTGNARAITAVTHSRRLRFA